MSKIHHSSSLLNWLLGEIRLVFVRSCLVVCQPALRTFNKQWQLSSGETMYFCPLPCILASKRWIFLSGNETCLAHLFWGLQLNVEGHCLSFLSTTTFFSFEEQEIKAVLCCLWQAFSLIDPDSVFPWKSPSHLDSAFERKLRCCTCILMFCGCLAVCKPEM